LNAPRTESNHSLASVVVPVLNEEDNLSQLVARVRQAFVAANRPAELLVVLDGCTDNSLSVLLGLQSLEVPLRIIELAHGVGQHAAIGVGLNYVRGNSVLTIDADLQNPPEALPEIARRLEAGFDAVGTTRKGRRDAGHRALASAIFAKSLKLVGVRHTMGDPGCMLRGWRRPVVEAWLATGEPALYLPTQLNRHAEDYEEFEADHHARAVGESRYDALRLGRLFLRTLAVEVAPQKLSAPQPRVAAVYEEKLP
jgi:undecaprenyl-phosphate 4-deoxy-4-formamido-L-arabinose transferase